MKYYIFTGVLIILTILYISLSLSTDFTPIQANMFKNENTTSISKKDRAKLYAAYIFGYLLSILLVVYELVYLSYNYKDNIIFRVIQFILILILLILCIISNIFNEESKMVKVSHILQPFNISFWIILSSCFKKSILPRLLQLFT